MKLKSINIYNLALINSVLWINGVDIENLTILKSIGLVTTFIMILLILRELIKSEDFSNAVKKESANSRKENS